MLAPILSEQEWCFHKLFHFDIFRSYWHKSLMVEILAIDLKKYFLKTMFLVYTKNGYSEETKKNTNNKYRFESIC
jgi:hypothetical protein